VSRQCCNLYINLDFASSVSINLNPAMLRPELVQDVETYLLAQGLPASSRALKTNPSGSWCSAWAKFWCRGITLIARSPSFG
jgi:hypothetical protein